MILLRPRRLKDLFPNPSMSTEAQRVLTRYQNNLEDRVIVLRAHQNL